MADEESLPRDLHLSIPLERAKRSTSEQLNVVARRVPSAPSQSNQILLRQGSRSPRKTINSMGIAERRRRRRSTQNSCSSTVPLPLRIVQEQTQQQQSLLSPRQIMCVGNYDLGRTIGRGQFGKVKIAKHVLTGETVAVKIIRKKKLKGDAMSMVRKEIEILKSVNHPYIVNLYEVLETDRVVFLILELASGGEALDFVVTHGKLTEDRARLFFRQIISALNYCHARNITHRDLKAENLLLDEDLNIKVIDFGLSATYKDGEMLDVPCGSPTYAAPELMLKQPYYGPQIDIWSLGVVLYVFVCGVLPFKGDGLKELYDKVTTGTYELPEFLSPECSHLIASMLCVDTKFRITMEQIKKHQWVTHNDNWKCKEFPIEQAAEPSLDDTILAQMELFGFSRSKVLQSIKDKSYDPASATFNLLQLRKGRTPESFAPIRARRVDSENPAILSGFVSMPTSASTSPSSSVPTSPLSSSCASPRGSRSPNTLRRTMQIPISSMPTTTIERPSLMRVQSQKFNHTRGRSFTDNQDVVAYPRFAKISPKRKRSSSDKTTDSDSDSEDDNGLSVPKTRVKFETPQSGLRFQLSPRDEDIATGKETGKETPTIEISEVEEQPLSPNQAMIRESKPKPLLRKTFSDRDFQNPQDPQSPRKGKQNPITKPVWSEHAGTPDVVLRDGTSQCIVKARTHARKSHTVTRETSKTLHGTWADVNPPASDSRLSSRMFSLTKQKIISQRSAEKEDPNAPRALRTPFSTTSSKDPKEILQRIQTYFKVVGVPFESVGSFALKGLSIEANVRFEIEVCAVPNLQDLYSVRTQRVDGEWEKYKEFCEKLFEALDLK